MRVLLGCTLLAFSTVGLAFGKIRISRTARSILMTSGSPLFARPIATPR